MALFKPLTAGALKLRNRVVMAPMTRARATADHTPQDMMAEHFGVRAGSAGLLITDATNISIEAVGWANSPGIFTKEHVAAWRKVTDKVHENDGLIACQLWHTGRQSVPSLPSRNGLQPVSASDVALSGKHPSGEMYSAPRPLETKEIPRLVEEYANAARNAIEAGFDAVEIHGANGYLLDQFLQTASNKRTDKYGGSIENRVRVVREVITAVAEQVGSDRTGIRFSPNGVYGEMGDPDFAELFDAAIAVAAEHKLAYVHVMDGLGFGAHKYVEDKPYTLQRARSVIAKVQGGTRTTAVFGNVGYDGGAAEKAVASDDGADAIAFGRPYLANPDLPEKLKSGAELAPLLAQPLWYHGGEEGYTKLPGTVKSG